MQLKYKFIIAILIVASMAYVLESWPVPNRKTSIHNSIPQERSRDLVESATGGLNLYEPKILTLELDVENYSQLDSFTETAEQEVHHSEKTTSSLVLMNDSTEVIASARQSIASKPRFQFSHEEPINVNHSTPVTLHQKFNYYADLSIDQLKIMLEEGDTLARFFYVVKLYQIFKDFYKADTVDEERLLTIFDQLEYACIQGVRDNYSYYAFILSYMYLRKTPKYDTTTAYAWALVNDWMEGISYGGWSYKVPSYDPEFAAEAEAMAILFINLYLDKFEPGTATRSQMVFRREKDD